MLARPVLLSESSEHARRGFEAVEVFRRIKKVSVVAGFRIQREIRRDLPFGVEFQHIVVGAVERRPLGDDLAQIGGLVSTGIRIGTAEQAIEAETLNEGQ